MTNTASAFAALWAVDYATATGFIKFLMARGLAKEAGKQPAARGFGKPSNLYTVPLSVILDLETPMAPATPVEA